MINGWYLLSAQRAFGVLYIHGSNVLEVDTHGLANNWLRELVGTGWLRIETVTSMMKIEFD